MIRVTVLMTVFNGMPHLPEAVESMRRQTIGNWRMVVVDDGSTDGSADYLASCEDPRVRSIRQANQGLGTALNRGLGEIETEFTARMDADDVAEPARLERQIAFLDEHPDVGLLGTQVRRLGTRRSASVSACARDHETIVADLREGRNQMYHPTVMIRTPLLRSVGGYWEHRRGEEWDLFLRLSEITRLANLDEVLLQYRVHSGSMTGADIATMRSWIDYACYCADCRRTGAAPLGFADFERQRPSHILARAIRGLEMQARKEYRLGVAEWLGDHPMRGRARLALSALIYPPLSARRLAVEARRALASIWPPAREPVAAAATTES